jgi:zinc and cadmium transporter
MVSFAIGALLGAAFLGVLPHALEAGRDANVHAIPATVLGGLLGFFLLEKLVLWRHCHTDQCEAHGHTHVADLSRPVDEHRNRATGYLVVVGDAVHNFVDGVLIAAAFYTDVHLGVVTALAVAAHEIPQEVGDFAILLHSGFGRGQALFYNMLSTLTTVIGGLLAYLSLELARAAVPYVLAIAASSFIYIAVADLIPGLHKRLELRATFEQLVLIGAGIFIIYSVDAILH